MFDLNYSVYYKIDLNFSGNTKLFPEYYNEKEGESKR